MPTVVAPALPSRARGRWVLALAGFLFGSTFLVVQGAVDRAAVLPFLAVRFLIGTAVLWPLARRQPATAHEVRHGVLAGLTLLAGFLLQTTGLKTTTSATSAFITYLLVVIVPMIGVARTRIAPPLNVLVGVLLAVAGLYLLSGGTEGIGTGELLTVGAAFFFALHIVVLGEVSGHHDPIRLTMWQALTVGVCCFFPGFFAPGGYSFDARISTAPSAPPMPSASPARAPSTAADTGSSRRMIAAWDSGTTRCAHVMHQNAAAVAPTPQKAAANHTPASNE